MLEVISALLADTHDQAAAVEAVFAASSESWSFRGSFESLGLGFRIQGPFEGFIWVLLTDHKVSWPKGLVKGPHGDIQASCIRWLRSYLVAEWIHFTLFGIILPTLKLKVYTFGGLWTQQLRTGQRQTFDFSTLSWVQCLMFGAYLWDLIVQSLTFGELRLEGLRLCRFRALPADLAFANLGFRGL